MSFVRPEIIVALHRAREVILGLVVAGLGAWLVWRGGYVLGPIGLVILGLGLGLALLAQRRMRFAQGNDAPGAVEVDEGQIAYFGPKVGGSVGLPELVEIRLVAMRGHRLWRLKQADGQALLIPVDAAGAERLFDAFVSLPGMDTSALLAALEPRSGAAGTAVSVDAETRLVWRRAGSGVVAR